MARARPNSAPDAIEFPPGDFAVQLRAIIEKFRDEFDVFVIHAWGMSETSPLATIGNLLPMHRDLPFAEQASVQVKQGRAIYGVELKIVDEHGTPLAHDGSIAGDLFETAETPMLFWKTEDRIGRFPDSLDLVKDRVEKAWKFQRARESKAVPKAKEIADGRFDARPGFVIPPGPQQDLAKEVRLRAGHGAPDMVDAARAANVGQRGAGAGLHDDEITIAARAVPRRRADWRMRTCRAADRGARPSASPPEAAA